MRDSQTNSFLVASVTRPLLRPVAAFTKASFGRSNHFVPWPMNTQSGPLQFWRLSRRLELQRPHGRLLVHGNGYWK